MHGFVLSAADLGASHDDDDEELESLFAGSQSATRCPAMSTDSDPTVAGLDLSGQKGITGVGVLYGQQKRLTLLVVLKFNLSGVVLSIFVVLKILQRLL